MTHINNLAKLKDEVFSCVTIASVKSFFFRNYDADGYISVTVIDAAVVGLFAVRQCHF